MYNSTFLLLCCFLAASSLFLIAFLTNIVFIFLVSLSVIVLFSTLLMFIGYEFTAVWLLIVYGGAVAMFLVIATSLITGEVLDLANPYTSLKDLKYLLVPGVFSLGGFNFLLLMDLDLFIKFFTPAVSEKNFHVNFSSKYSSDMAHLGSMLFINHNKVIICLGILLFIIMVAIINILFSEHLK